MRYSDKDKLNERKKEAYNFFISKGYTPEQSAGIVGNLIQESRLDPGVISTFKGEGSFGIAQWNPSPKAGARLDKLKEFAKSNKTTPDDFKTQLEFIAYELDSQPHLGKSKLLKAKSVEEATEIFSSNYERPHKDYAHNDKRINNAKGIYLEYNDNNIYIKDTKGDIKVLSPEVATEAHKKYSPIIKREFYEKNYGINNPRPKAEASPKVTIAKKEVEEIQKEVDFKNQISAVLKQEQRPPERVNREPIQEEIPDISVAENEFFNYFNDIKELKEGGDVPISKEGLYEHPRQPVIVPTEEGRITMKGIDYDVLGIDNFGNVQLMKPGEEYLFKGKDILELPILQQGGRILSLLNPKNWGVTDYSDKGDFNTAYSTARKAGEKEFMWNGQRFSTKAYTDKNTSGNIINKTIANNTYPYTASTKGKFKLDNNVLAKAQSDYKKKNIGIKELVKIYDTATSDEYPDITFGEYRANKRGSTGRIPEPSDITPSYDALFLQQGLPQKYNSFEQAKYVPSKRSGNLNTIYKFNNKWEEDLWKDLSEYGNSDFLESNETERYVKGSHVAGASLKNFKYSKGKDDRGEYVSYYDKNDYGNILDYIPNSETFDIYGRLYYKDYGDGQKKRMYYTDKELSELDTNKRDFDTLALQKELANRGYKLPKSTKEDGSFDGVFGDETKNALLDFKNSKKK